MRVFKIQMKMNLKKLRQKINLIKETAQLTSMLVAKSKALYENGWFIGTVKYFNTSLQEHYVLFTEDTEDYTAQVNIAGVKVQQL